uniref:Large ribosomal subunit protein uL24 C-terminal domain-containing protein n=1 Tax=Pinguiococcus pyrenoidosus TaxID=172671 RepID=A0A7R9U7E1_9STRA|mmetsp:Transcript_17944/g.68050  ORF Transcript_17944/g.68050 Transcript_17944/m.68050 type:complete len:200 (+) Transcript_17944:102-701(+)
MFKQPRGALRALLLKPKFRPDRRGELGRWVLKKGDLVEVVDGISDKGKRGKILHIFKKRERVVVDGVNVRKSWVPATDPTQRGQFVEKPWTIHYSNVQIVCPETNKPTKVGYRRLETGKHERFARISGAPLPLPPEHLEKPPVGYRVGPLDTPGEESWRQTFQGFDEHGREIGIKDWGEQRFHGKKHLEKVMQRETQSS